ncbi:MAG TPA: NAD-dependent epimerase/dehydratase family protein [Acidobacteriaceae bacterium]|nr:NAD-dependent epimerase/dehydratase family protein [Acidobacteriaceae bacterium]
MIHDPNTEIQSKPAIAAPPLPRSDLDHILGQTESLWPEMRRQRIFVTGGTGFFGCWLLESFLAANHAFDLQAQAVVLTRSAQTFRQRCPHIAANSAIELVEGDVKTFDFPVGEFPFIINAATNSVMQPSPHAAEDLFSTIVDGTRRCLEFAESHGTRKFLLTSSGAVYGPQPSVMTHIAESYSGAPNPLRPGSEYGEGKRVAEMLCGMTARRTGMECKVARCFAFVGPHLPLDAHFAIGNFIGDAMHGSPILIQGDGTPMRSYLYAADLAIWLWTMLFHAPSAQAFNVGSSHALSIRAVAEEVAAAIQPGIEIRAARQPIPGAPLHCYVPDVSAAAFELGLREIIPLRDAIRRTAAWHRPS